MSDILSDTLLQVQVQRTEGILPDRMNLSQCDASSEASMSSTASSRLSNGGGAADTSGVSEEGSHIGVRNKEELEFGVWTLSNNFSL